MQLIQPGITCRCPVSPQEQRADHSYCRYTGADDIEAFDETEPVDKVAHDWCH